MIPVIIFLVLPLDAAATNNRPQHALPMPEPSFSFKAPKTCFERMEQKGFSVVLEAVVQPSQFVDFKFRETDLRWWDLPRRWEQGESLETFQQRCEAFQERIEFEQKLRDIFDPDRILEETWTKHRCLGGPRVRPPASLPVIYEF